MTVPTEPTVQDAVAAFARRREPTRALGEDAGRIAAACHDIAVRFHRGGQLIAFGNGAAAADAAHLAVEFVHPVTVGKRALPAVSLVTDPATVTGIARRSGFDDTFAAQLRTHGRPEDIAEIRDAPTARRAYEIWEASGLLRACGNDVCARVADTLHRFSAEVGRPLHAKAAMVDFTGQRVVAATEPDWVSE